MLLGVSFVIPFAVLFALLAANVRLGQGYFAYRYSPVRDLRTLRAFIAIGIGLIACAAVWLVAQSARRRVGIGLLTLAMLFWGAWTFWGPPNAMTQQLYGMTSPSTDGAFMVESMRISSIGEYLREFDARLERSVDEMKGTRVLSNPPGMTLFAHAVSSMRVGRPWIERWLIETEQVETDDVSRLADAISVAAALCVVWALSGLMAYALGRLFLSPAGAAVFAILVTFNPCAIDFVPGKDPAQLLTINAMLWAWFAARKRQSPSLAALAGMIAVIGATVSLVHIWVALIAFAATVWESSRSGRVEDPRVSREEERASSTLPLRGISIDTRAALRRVSINSIAAILGASTIVALAYLTLGWNIPATLLAVSRRWGAIQKTFDMSRPIWFAIGLPIFLLFLAPGIYALAGLSLHRRRMNLGTRLAICTALVMALIYAGFGVTYELPRLWVAFLPTLALGFAIDRPLLRGSENTLRPRVAMALMLIALAQIAYTAMHWTLFDVRETEFRLISQRYYQ